jgi:hypothetical protein
VWLADHPVINSVANVCVVERDNLITYRGSTMVANSLQAAGGGSDWEMRKLAADLLHVFSKLPQRRQCDNGALDLSSLVTGGSSRGDSFVSRRGLGGAN